MKIGLIFFIIFITNVWGSCPPISYDLYEIAKKSLESNIEVRYLTAGRHQFKQLWIRDFGWSSKGLLLIDQDAVVRDQLELFLSNKRSSDDLISKVMDSMDPVQRVIDATLAKIFPWLPASKDLDINHLKPYFVDESKSTAIDSNMMTLFAAINYVRKTQDIAWWEKYQSEFVKLYRYYDKKFTGGLIYQSPHTDWQDSVKREGHAFLTNLIYYVISRDLMPIDAFNIDQNKLDNFRDLLVASFFDVKSGLFKSLDYGPYISLDGNLFALEWDLWDRESVKSKDLYQALKKSLFFQKNLGTPGWNTYPNYPANWKNQATTLSGLPYHDEVYWSWLMALSGKVAAKFDDFALADKMALTLTKMATRDQAVAEIFFPKESFQPWESWLYKSERPFSWGSAFIIDFLRDYCRYSF